MAACCVESLLDVKVNNSRSIDSFCIHFCKYSILQQIIKEWIKDTFRVFFGLKKHTQVHGTEDSLAKEWKLAATSPTPSG